MTFTLLMQEFLTWCRQHRKPRTADYYAGQLEPVAALIGEMPAAAVRRRDVVGVKMTWHRIQALQRLYSWAMDDMDLVDVNPFAKLRRPPLGRRQLALEGGEVAALLRGAYADFRAFLLALRESGGRPQEIASLRMEWLQRIDGRGDPWQVIAQGGAGFFLETWKARDRMRDQHNGRVLPVSPRLGRYLLRLRRNGRKWGLVFKTAAGQPWTKERIHARMRRLRERVFLPRIAGKNVSAYTFRHTTATVWASLGVAMPLLSAAMGHTSIATTARYCHPQRLAVFRELQTKVWRRRP